MSKKLFITVEFELSSPTIFDIGSIKSQVEESLAKPSQFARDFFNIGDYLSSEVVGVTFTESYDTREYL
jgi:exosome complex RNA-binding protein Csl4